PPRPRAALGRHLGRPGAPGIPAPASTEGRRITLAETGLDAMTGCRVKRVERYVHGDTFLLTYGDGVSDVDLGRLVAFHRGHGRPATVTAVRAPGRFGEITIEGDQVVQFQEKPLLSPGRINGGFFVLNRC